MRLVTYELDGTPGFGVCTSDGVVPMSGVVAEGCDSVRRLLELDALGEVEALVRGRDPEVGLDQVTLLPPVPDSAKILCVGLNYHEHAIESETVSPGVQAAAPTIFTRFADSHVGHGAGIVKPAVSAQFDYEGELAVVIGRPIFRASAGEAIGAVAGYSVFNDGTARDWQLKSSQWQPGKNFPKSGAFGPYLVTVDEVGDIERQTLTTRVNGALRQRAVVKDLIHGIGEVIAFISQFTPLAPGDVIATGTPSGAAMFSEPQCFLEVGDVVEVAVSSVGTLRNEVIADTADGQADPDQRPAAASMQATSCRERDVAPRQQ